MKVDNNGEFLPYKKLTICQKQQTLNHQTRTNTKFSINNLSQNNQICGQTNERQSEVIRLLLSFIRTQQIYLD